MTVASTVFRRSLRFPLLGNPHSRWERWLAEGGFQAIAGLDEAGRGSWAGPLVAAAVILPPPTPALARRLQGLRDSKQLSAAQRERLAHVISSVALGVGLGRVPPGAIDLLGLSIAGRLAMQRAVQALPERPDYLLIDAFPLPSADCLQEAIVFGDALCRSIAAASVVAKVERDRLLDSLGQRYPGYGFPDNKGYGTRQHLRALKELGPTPEHRFSYAPVRAVLEAGSRC